MIEENGYKISRGATRVQDMKVQFDSVIQSMRLRGKIAYFPLKGHSWKTLEIDLSGALDKSGFITLKSDRIEVSKTLERRIVAKATCLREVQDCQSFFIDIYINAEGFVYHHQIESQPEALTQEELGPYVGTNKEDIETLLEIKPETSPEAPAEPKSRPISQAIGPVNAGRLEKGADLLKYEKDHEPTGFHIIRPQRLSHYATNELAFIIVQMGLFTKKELNGYVLSVGDLSTEAGGPLRQHRSHQNGLDADIAYYFNNKSFQGYFASALEVEKPHASWLAESQWRLFKHVVKTQLVDRIFIHETLKKTLCNVALQNGELQREKQEGLAYETLRRLMPDKEHDTHFHIRVKCSRAQIRCRQMAEPGPGSGCF